MKKVNGIKIVIGKCGSKSKTLNTKLLDKHRFNKKIYTLEEPAEYHIQNIKLIDISETEVK